MECRALESDALLTRNECSSELVECQLDSRAKVARLSMDDADRRCCTLQSLKTVVKPNMPEVCASSYDQVTSRHSAPLIRRGEVEKVDQEFLECVAADVLRSLETDAPAGPCHVMVFGHGAPSLHRSSMMSDSATKRLLTISHKLVARFEQEVVVLSVRLLVSPPGNSPQSWHLDYRTHAGLDAQTVFAALTPCTSQNCTEILMPKDEAAASRLDHCVRQIDLEREAEHVVRIPRQDVVQQSLLVERFGVVCAATSRLPHRRGPTTDASHTRIVLNIDFTTRSVETVRSIGFVDDDFVTAGESGGVVGRSVVDDLHSEVVVEVVE